MKMRPSSPPTPVSPHSVFNIFRAQAAMASAVPPAAMPVTVAAADLAAGVATMRRYSGLTWEAETAPGEAPEDQK